jgi:beta-lactamase superfamily II metal-dependent hydrolase
MENTESFSSGWHHFTGTFLRSTVTVTVLSLFLISAGQAAPKPDTPKALQIYFVDVEGGQATLFVTPEGKSLLIDTGWSGNDGRDADRILAATKLAGITKIDFVLLTHYHRDHAGGITQLAARVPIRTVIDHGENREPQDVATEEVWQDYQKLLAKEKFDRMIAKAGETLPLEDIEARIVSSDGAVIEKPLSGGGGKNAGCNGSEQRSADQTENARSLGVLFTFGKLRILDLGDLTWDKERELMCPVNKLGLIDIYIVSHHGWNQSNSPELLNGIAPRLAIMDNGAKKGGTPSAWDIIKASPHLEDFWQLHFSDEGGAAHNVADPFIANLSGPDAGNYLKVTARTDGSFDVFNSRTQAMKKYAAAKH